MPMIDGYATEGTFTEPRPLAQRLAETLMRIEEVPALPMFRHNTAAFIHARSVHRVLEADIGRGGCLNSSRLWVTRASERRIGRCGPAIPRAGPAQAR